MKQLSLFVEKRSNAFGGTCLIGKPKTARPLGIRKSNHLVLKAKRSDLLLRRHKTVAQTLKKYGERFGVKIYALAIHCDHIHCSIKIHSRDAYRKWIRSVTSRLVSAIVGLKFSLRPWSRIVSWGKPFFAVKRYILGNQIEANFILATWRTVDGMFDVDVGDEDLRRPCGLCHPRLARSYRPAPLCRSPLDRPETGLAFRHRQPKKPRMDGDLRRASMRPVARPAAPTGADVQADATMSVVLPTPLTPPPPPARSSTTS